MQFNSNADEQYLVSLLNDLTGMDNNTYALKAKTRDINTANKTVWSWIHEAYGGWLYDDSNNTTDFPTATASVVANQRDYTLPSELLTVRGVEIKTTGGVWQELRPTTEEKIRDIMSEKQFMITASQPMWYTPYSNSVKIYPATNYSQTSSILISYDRGTSNFASTDTTKTPGFASLFHESLAYGAGYFFSLYKGIPQALRLQLDWEKWEKRIKQYYSERWAEMFPPRIDVIDAVREAQ